ncbi:MAG: hypothetical protein U1F65_11810 [Verrucomicrobiota bacterium]
MDENQSSPNLTDLQAQCQWLRKQVQITLVLLIMVSGVLTLFLYRQQKNAATELAGMLPLIEDYNKNQGPMMDDFIKRMIDYGKTHPDFNGIYKKYGLDQLSVNPPPGTPAKK